MHGMQNWCYTLFSGVLFSGIVLMLTPDERYRPLMRVILGGFLLICMVSWIDRVDLNISFNSDLAEMQRLETAGRTEKYFSERAIELSEKEIEKAASQYLSDYGIKRGEFEIYIKTAENPDGTQTAYLLLRLPQRVAEHYLTISRALEYRLGADVRIETYGTTEESR